MCRAHRKSCGIPRDRSLCVLSVNVSILQDLPRGFASYLCEVVSGMKKEDIVFNLCVFRKHVNGVANLFAFTLFKVRCSKIVEVRTFHYV